VHTEPDEAATDPEERGAENWLHHKMTMLRSRRFVEPMARSRQEAEKFLLEVYQAEDYWITELAFFSGIEEQSSQTRFLSWQ
jgi:hypothetical protein